MDTAVYCHTRTMSWIVVLCVVPCGLIQSVVPLPCLGSSRLVSRRVFLGFLILPRRAARLIHPRPALYILHGRLRPLRMVKLYVQHRKLLSKFVSPCLLIAL